MLDSLVRVSRRVAYDHYASILAEARSSVRAGRIAPEAITLPEGSHVPRAFVRPPRPTLACPRKNTPVDVDIPINISEYISEAAWEYRPRITSYSKNKVFDILFPTQ